MVFNHSVKVPMQYRKAAKILDSAITKQKSVRSLVYEEKHAKTSGLMVLMSRYFDNKGAIESAIEKTNILAENPRLNPSLARVLITELLFGTGILKAEEAKPVACVLSFQEKLQEAIGSVATESTSTQARVSRPRYVRINTNAYSIDEAKEMLAQENWRRNGIKHENYDEFLEAVQSIAEDQYMIDMHIPSLLIFDGQWRRYWAQHELVAEKKLLLQDKATSIVSELLSPKPGSVVLDMCAAPGMKTIHLSNLIQNQGTIYAVEQDAKRYNLMCSWMSEAKATCVKPIKADVLTLTNDDVPDVEYILVDPSCSGSGMQSRFSLGNETKDEERLWKLRGLQVTILQHAMNAFPKAKRIVYSTCSIYEEENEQVVQRCLERCPHFKLLNGKKCLERKWNNVGNKEYTGIGKNCLYAIPDKDMTDGIFIAVFERIAAE